MKKILFLLLTIVFSSICIFAQTNGELDAFDKKGKQLGECPLKQTNVKADISGFLSRVRVTQEFENNFTEPIEAVYVFPLPANSAVDDMTMKVGERTIRGKIMKRGEAREVYENAKNAGQTASLLDQERPNVFTQAIANIMPNEKVTIEISYVETLKYDEGSYEFVFPMVVGPRYTPASMTTEQKQTISPPVAATTRAGHDISIKINLDAGVPVEEIRSTSHEVETINLSSNSSSIKLKSGKTIPNKDFILRYDVTGKKISDAILTHSEGKGGYFSLILQPPDKIESRDVTPKEIVFVLDTSGSMSGFPIEKAKESMKMALDGLYPNDTFNLITFAGDTAILFDKPVPATRGNLAKAQAFLESRQGGGGTEMMKAIKASLDPSDSQEHLRIVCFMTDGEIGNDGEILSEIKKHPNARVFSFGIGSSINRFLLQKMADEGRGEAEFVSLQEDGTKAAKRFHERIRNPLLTDISIDWNGLEVADVYPKRQPDLFSAKPLVIHGRYTKSGSGTIKLKGKFAGQDVIREIPVNFSENATGNDVLATLWARTRIDDLMSTDYNSVAQNGKTKPEIEQTITQLGLEYRLMTQFTSFVAVEEKVVNQNGKSVRIDVPVELPSGVSDKAIQVDGIDNDVIRVNQTGFYGTQRTPGLSKIPIKGNLFKRKLPVKQTAGRGSGSGIGNGVGPSATPVPPAKPISGGVLNGKATNLPKPGYPVAAKAVSAGGSVSVQVVIDENGIVLSSSATSGHPLLRQAAEQASKAATFSPTLLSGQKVKTVGVIVYNFLPGSGSSTVTEGVRSVSDEPPLSPKEQKLVRIAEKSHTWVYDLILRLEKGDNIPTANEAYFVKDGKAEIQIQLSSTSPEMLEKLKMLGFEISQEKQQLVLHGRISIEKISQLAEIEEVRFILPNVK
jgi:Ca-activated chloride channel homolog